MSLNLKIAILHITVPLFIALLSFFVLSDIAKKEVFTDSIVSSIDSSKNDVLKLAGSSTAVSVAITALPSDIATPVAENLADLSKGFMVVLTALYLERVLVLITGIISFKIIIPAACLVYVIGHFINKEHLKSLSYKLACFAVALFLVIPTGAFISGLITERYGEEIENTINSANRSAELLQKSVNGSQSEENNMPDDTNGLEKVFDSLQSTGDKIALGTSEFMRYLSTLINHYIEVIAIMFVTSCVVPIIVVLCFIWICRIIFSGDNTARIADAVTDRLSRLNIFSRR